MCTKRKNKMEKFSYSRINTFDQCPQKYKIQYIDLISTNNDSIEAFMGNRVHNVLENLYSIDNLKNQFISFDKLIDMYSREWHENWHENIFISNYKFDINYYNHNTVYDNGLKCLKNFYKRFNQKGYFKDKILELEFPFQIEVGDYKLRGYIDRIDRNSKDEIDIFDYKTGVKSKSKIQALNDLQLAIYELAIREKFKKCKKINLHLYYLRNDKLVSFNHSLSQLEKLKNKIINKIDVINSSKDFIAKESILCEWCFYWEQCEIKATSNPSIKIV
tara:strand:- start:175 stop:999 length:825 start_codon:yes stop_codon:yes gene_type:complete